MIFKIVYGKEIHLLNSIATYKGLFEGIKSSFKKLPPTFSISYADAEGDQISISNQQDFKIFETSVKSDKPVRITIQEAHEEKIVTQAPVAEKTGFVEVIQSIQELPLKTEETKPEIVNESFISTISKEEVEALVQQEVRRIVPQLTESILNNVSRTTSSKISVEKPTFHSNEVVHERVTCDGCQTYPIVGFRYKCIICHDFDFCDKCESEGKHPHAFIKIRHPSQVPKVLITSEQDINPGLDINGQRIDFKDLINNPGPVIDIANQFIPGLNLTEEKVKGLCNRFKDCKRGGERGERGHCKFGRWQGMFNNIFQGFGPQTEENVQKKTEQATEQKVEPKVEPKTQQKVEQKVSQKTQVSSEGKKTFEQRDYSSALYLQEMFERDLSLMLKFVQANPRLSKCELAEKWIEENL